MSAQNNAVSGSRCGAKTRSGAPCQNPPMGFGIRCRMHGGAPGSGAPIGNKNALKTGYYTQKAIEARRELAKSRREAAEYDNSWIDAVVQKVRRERKKAEQARLRQTADVVGYDNSRIDVERVRRDRKKAEQARLRQTVDVVGFDISWIREERVRRDREKAEEARLRQTADLVGCDDNWIEAERVRKDREKAEQARPRQTGGAAGYDILSLLEEERARRDCEKAEQALRQSTEAEGPG